MDLTPKTNVIALIKAHPFLEEFLATLSDRFKLLKNPVMRNTVGRLATLEQAAVMGGLDVADLIARLQSEIGRRAASGSGARGQPRPGLSREERQELLRGIIRDLHEGLPLAAAQARFNEHFSDVSAPEIAAMEQALMAGGVPQSDVKRLCDVHVQVFKGALDQSAVPQVPDGHPVHTFMLENRACEALLAKVEAAMQGSGIVPSARSFVAALVDDLSKVDLHYLRKENQLFPRLESHGITGPSQVMWGIHDDIRGMMRTCRALMTGADAAAAVAELARAAQAIRDMIYKEERILFPMCLETLSDEDWQLVRAGEGEIGYAWIQPPSPWRPATGKARDAAPPKDKLLLDTGAPTLEQVRLIFTHLPLDISFVDENDVVVFYSANRDRIFPRSPGVIGRTVQNCHPPRSLGAVTRILNDFKAGTRETADFWIRSHGKLVFIRYIAVRNEARRYIGCLEVTQDVTAIRGLEGERRLLD